MLGCSAIWGGKLCTAGGVQENTRCGWHTTAKGTMPWQLCSAIIQVFLGKSKTIPENSIKFKTEVIFIKICCKAYNTGFGSFETPCSKNHSEKSGI